MTDLETTYPRDAHEAQELLDAFSAANGRAPTTIEELVAWRVSLMTDLELETANARDAHAYRLTQAQELLDAFSAANGRAATTIEELVAWMEARAHNQERNYQ